MKCSITSVISVIIASIMLVGCGQQGSVVDRYSDKVEITYSWWGNDDRHAYTMDGLDIFNRNNSNINVNYRYGEWSGYERKNNVWMESNTQADVMQINYAWLNTYSRDGEGYYDLYQLTDYIDLSGYDDNDLAFGEINGKLNAIPIAYNTSTICYNKEIFEEHGLEIPKTWDDLFAAAEVLGKDDIYVIGSAKKHLMLMLIAYYEQTVGEKVFNEDGNFCLNEDDIGYMLDFYVELLDKKVLLPIDQFERAKFATGECAGSVFWISDADNYCGALADNGYTPLISSYPMATDAILSGIYMKPATMYTISDTTEHPKEAAKLLNYLINGTEMIELQATEKGVPANQNAVKHLEKKGQVEGFGYDAYNQMLLVKENMSSMIPAMENEDVIEAFKMDADAYLYEVNSREETIRNIYKDVREALK